MRRPSQDRVLLGESLGRALRQGSSLAWWRAWPGRWRPLGVEQRHAGWRFWRQISPEALGVRSAAASLGVRHRVLSQHRQPFAAGPVPRTCAGRGCWWCFPRRLRRRRPVVSAPAGVGVSDVGWRQVPGVDVDLLALSATMTARSDPLAVRPLRIWVAGHLGGTTGSARRLSRRSFAGLWPQLVDAGPAPCGAGASWCCTSARLRGAGPGRPGRCSAVGAP